jgi:hypothetical protein
MEEPPPEKRTAKENAPDGDAVAEAIDVDDDAMTPKPPPNTAPKRSYRDAGLTGLTEQRGNPFESSHNMHTMDGRVPQPKRRSIDASGRLDSHLRATRPDSVNVLKTSQVIDVPRMFFWTRSWTRWRRQIRQTFSGRSEINSGNDALDFLVGSCLFER